MYLVYSPFHQVLVLYYLFSGSVSPNLEHLNRGYCLKNIIVMTSFGIRKWLRSNVYTEVIKKM